MRRLAGVLVSLSSVAILAAGVAGAVPDSRTVAEPDPWIGAVFLGNGPLHTCSGSVLDSRDGDLVVTAAHCVIGNGAFLGFAPGYTRGREPVGRWEVAEVYLDPRWVRGFDADHDYAILRVRPGAGAPPTSVEQAVGGGFRPADGPAVDDLVTVTGYGVGLLDSPTTCTRPVGRENGYASFACDGFVYGTSGGPWVEGNDLVGIIAGPHLGGCLNGISYTPPFDDALHDLIRRAENRAPSDSAPIADLVNDC
ncbi:trypsin-like serine peptidase [Nocardia takedensis]|uniref:trypsin-like serine peptidase n=1 Tax=Nocardia takedensis TaxID=259390 RepID=UPI0002F737EE|nr:trypsin-like serine protease [Nocardia takedensis]